MRIHLLILIELIFNMSANDLIGQSTTNQTLVWAKYQNDLHISEKLILSNEIESRNYVQHFRGHQRLLPATTLIYKPNKGLIKGFGFTYFQQFNPQDPNIKGVLNNEYRFLQLIEFSNSISKLEVKTRVQIEERLIEAPNNKIDFSLRERFRFKLAFPLISKDDKAILKAIIFDEIMVQQGAGLKFNIFDQNRFGGGLSARIKESFLIETTLFNWYQQKPDLLGFYNRTILSLSLIHSISL